MVGQQLPEMFCHPSIPGSHSLLHGQDRTLLGVGSHQDSSKCPFHGDGSHRTAPHMSVIQNRGKGKNDLTERTEISHYSALTGLTRGSKLKHGEISRSQQISSPFYSQASKFGQNWPELPQPAAAAPSSPQYCVTTERLGTFKKAQMIAAHLHLQPACSPQLQLKPLQIQPLNTTRL